MPSTILLILAESVCRCLLKGILLCVPILLGLHSIAEMIEGFIITSGSWVSAAGLSPSWVIVPLRRKLWPIR